MQAPCSLERTNQWLLYNGVNVQLSYIFIHFNNNVAVCRVRVFTAFYPNILLCLTLFYPLPLSSVFPNWILFFPSFFLFGGVRSGIPSLVIYFQEKMPYECIRTTYCYAMRTKCTGPLQNILRRCV